MRTPGGYLNCSALGIEGRKPGRIKARRDPDLTSKGRTSQSSPVIRVGPNATNRAMKKRDNAPSTHHSQDVDSYGENRERGVDALREKTHRDRLEILDRENQDRHEEKQEQNAEHISHRGSPKGEIGESFVRDAG
jgi:hypothetical protein